MGLFSKIKTYLSKAANYVSNVVKSGFSITNNNGKLTIRSNYNPNLGVVYDTINKEATLETTVKGYNFKQSYNVSNGNMTTSLKNGKNCFKWDYDPANSTMKLDVLKSGHYFSNELNTTGLYDVVKYRHKNGDTTLEAKLEDPVYRNIVNATSNTVKNPVVNVPKPKLFSIVSRLKLPDLLSNLYIKNNTLGRVDYDGSNNVLVYSY